MVTLFCVQFTLAFTFDNVKDYDSVEKEITITNLFGLGGEIAKIQLVSDQVQYVMPGKNRMVAELLFKNYDKDYNDALIKTEFYNVNKNMNKFERDFVYKYWKVIGTKTIPITERACELRTDKDGKNEYCFDKIIGSEVVDKYEWVEFNNVAELPGGEVRVGIFTDVLQNDYVEWIPTWFGEEINEWAIWTDGLTSGLLTYYKLNETSGSNLLESRFGILNGTTFGDPSFVPAVIGNGLISNLSQGANVTNLLDMNIQSEISISAWINVTGWTNNGGLLFGSEIPGMVGIRILEGTSTINAEMIKGTSRNRTASDISLTANETYHVVAIFSGNTSRLFINGTEQTSNSQVGSVGLENMTDQQTNTFWFSSAGSTISQTPLTVDEVGIWNRTLTDGEVLELYNNGTGINYNPSPSQTDIKVQLIHPTDLKITVNSSLTFVGNITPVSGNVTNATLFVWNSDSTLFSETTNILTGNNTNQTSFIVPNIVEGDYVWNIRGCMENLTALETICSFDNIGNANFSLSVSNIVINSKTFNGNTTEGALETFTLNLTKASSKQISTIDFIYNTTIFSSPYVVTNNEAIASTSITIPSRDEASLVPFKWAITLTDGTQSNTTLSNQTVNVVLLGNCSTYTNLIYNFTIFDEEDQTDLTNSTIEIELKMFNSDKTTSLLNFSQSFDQIHEATICMNESLLTTVNYSVDSVIKYFTNKTGPANENTSTDYAVEYYNILNEVITNTTIPKHIKLYDLKSEDSTEFQLTFRDASLALAPNVLVQLHRQYVADGDFKVVELPLTDSSGQAVLHLVRNDVIYNFIMVDENGNILATFNKVTAFCQDFTIGECTIKLNIPVGADEVYNYTDDLGISFTQPVYSSSNDLVTFDFVSNNLSAVTVSTTIIKESPFGNRTVCSNSLTSATGTLGCNVSSIVDTDRFLFIDISVNGVLKTHTTIDLESDGMFFGVIEGGFYAFMLILFIITMFMEDKQTLVIALMIGWAAILSMGLIKGAIFGFYSGGIWLVICALIILWKLKKEDSFG